MPRSSLIPYGFGGFEPMASLHREIDRLFDDAFRGFGSRSAGQEQAAGLPSIFNASMNVSETDKEYRVSVELPGVTEQDIDLTIDDDVLTIRGEKKIETERGGEKENFHCIERSYGTFQRSLRLPFAAKSEDVKAAFQNGVLSVTIPKSATQRERSRRIAIQGSTQGAQERGAERATQQGAHAQAGGTQPSGTQRGRH